jgi:hypothetical protein
VPSQFQCKDSKTLRDPLDRGWRLGGVYIAERPDFDRITFRLLPEPANDGRVARVFIESRPFADLAADGLQTPTEGNKAVVIRFSNAVALTRSQQVLPAKTAVKQATTTVASDGRVWTVLGVAGQGCWSIQVPMWSDPSTQDTPFVDVTVDVQH